MKKEYAVERGIRISEIFIEIMNWKWKMMKEGSWL